jgi:hypothetical protein
MGVIWQGCLGRFGPEEASLAPRLDRLRRLTATELDAALPEVVSSIDWSEAVRCLQQLQKSASAVQKLDYLLMAIKAIHDAARRSERAISGADDLVPLFLYVMVQSGIEQPDMEVDFMMELVDPALLSGEGGYYLTTLAGAALAVRQWKFA